jgi:predicted DNA binding CopG/RHH family protein
MKNRKQDVFDVKLDEEEKEISDALDKAIDKDQLKSVDNLEEELAFAREAAANYFKKDARVTLRLSSNDLAALRRKAA